MMLDMVKPYRPGVEARRTILLELRRREDAGERVTVRLLADALGLPRATIGRHLVTLRAAGLVTAKARQIGSLGLTDAGRIATD